jgi:hypothetical protein
MSRSDIGNYLGIAEETVCRIFARFQDDGLISSEYRNVKLKDIKRLEQIANQKSLRQTNVASLYSWSEVAAGRVARFRRADPASLLLDGVVFFLLFPDSRAIPLGNSTVCLSWFQVDCLSDAVSGVILPPAQKLLRFSCFPLVVPVFDFHFWFPLASLISRQSIFLPDSVHSGSRYLFVMMAAAGLGFAAAALQECLIRSLKGGGKESWWQRDFGKTTRTWHLSDFFWRAGHIMLSRYGFRQADQQNSTTNHGGD